MKLLQAFMGHSDMSTTNLYMRTSAEGLRKVININRSKTLLKGKM
jgi:site-specific recombinase XerD